MSPLVRGPRGRVRRVAPMRPMRPMVAPGRPMMRRRRPRFFSGIVILAAIMIIGFLLWRFVARQ